jgi:hypothetical protein
MTMLDQLYSDLRESKTDLARYVEATARDGRPYMLVPADAVKAWERRAPHAWAKVREWLAAEGKGLVEV